MRAIRAPRHDPRGDAGSEPKLVMIETYIPCFIHTSKGEACAMRTNEDQQHSERGSHAPLPLPQPCPGRWRPSANDLAPPAVAALQLERPMRRWQRVQPAFATRRSTYEWA
jgi:hypothetical protein